MPKSMSANAMDARKICASEGLVAVKGKRKGGKFWFRTGEFEGQPYCRARPTYKYKYRPQIPAMAAARRLAGYRKRYAHGPSLTFSMLPKPGHRLYTKTRPDLRGAGALMAIKEAMARPRKVVMAKPMMSDDDIANLLKRASATKRPSANPLAMLAEIGATASPAKPVSPSPVQKIAALRKHPKKPGFRGVRGL